MNPWLLRSHPEAPSDRWLSYVWGTMDVRVCSALCCTLACLESALQDFMKWTCPAIASFKLITSTAG